MKSKVFSISTSVQLNMVRVLEMQYGQITHLKERYTFCKINGIRPTPGLKTLFSPVGISNTIPSISNIGLRITSTTLSHLTSFNLKKIWVHPFFLWKTVKTKKQLIRSNAWNVGNSCPNVIKIYRQEFNNSCKSLKKI